MLLSLGIALLASLTLSAWLLDEFSLLTSPLKEELSLSGAAHDPTDHAGYALKLETLALPSAAWLARSIERAEASVDSSGVGLGT